ncbi:hypothetical protein [Actinomyces gaoshouyii]|uniref:hypothetical protein n=1 Tax=Actinomyces gaoshouyii TaxID=1960083 RepID=UPI0009C0D0FA|nr:hypothetical protein [Actinomyces gaoshouyii]ARD42459.1 hypothetical protein B6G06_09020 [Actinomyces gaoshouyii]
MDITIQIVIDLTCGISSARNLGAPERDHARRGVLRDLVRAARAGLRLPPDVVLVRGDLDVPTELKELETAVYERVVQLAALRDPGGADGPRARYLLYDLVAYEISPVLEEAR